MATKRKTYPSRTALVEALDINKSTLSRWLRRTDWPIRREPPWTFNDLKIIEEWREQTLREDRTAESRNERRGWDEFGNPVGWTNEELLEERVSLLKDIIGDLEQLHADKLADILEAVQKLPQAVARRGMDRALADLLALIGDAGTA